MLEKLNMNDFDVIFSLLKEGIPEHERGNYMEQKELLYKNGYEILVWKENLEIVAFVALEKFENIVLLEHFVVRKDKRNNGIGTKILKKLIWQNKDKLIVVEVDLPIDENNIRRIGFYKRNGFVLCKNEYFQPKYKKRNKVPLKLMVYEKELIEKEFTVLRNKIYKYVYGL